MPTFITIGYGDEAGYERTDPSLRDAAHAHDARLQAGGALIGKAGAPVQVRNHDAAGVETVPGPFLRADLPIAGFAVIEASDVHEAIELVSATPCAVANGVVEVWPLESTPRSRRRRHGIVEHGCIERQPLTPGCSTTSGDAPGEHSTSGPRERLFSARLAP